MFGASIYYFGLGRRALHELARGGINAPQRRDLRRLRVKGRFVKKEEEDLLKDLVGVV